MYKKDIATATTRTADGRLLKMMMDSNGDASSPCLCVCVCVYVAVCCVPVDL